MAEEYQQSKLHRRHEAEEEGEKREFYDESKSTTPFASLGDENNNVGSAADSVRDEVLTAEGPKDHGLFGFEEKKPATNDINGDFLSDESAIEATDRGLFGHFTGKKEEDVNKVDEQNEVANPKDSGLFGFEEKNPMVDDINDNILGDESGLFGQFTGKKEEDVKKVDEENEVVNPKDRGLFGFEEKKPTVDDIDGDILGDESVVKATDRGLFGQFTGKKEEDVKKVDEENEVATEFEKGSMLKPEEEEKKEEDKEEKMLQRSGSSSSISSSDEEETGAGGEKKKRKGLKEKIKEMASGGDEEKEKVENTENNMLEKEVEAPYEKPIGETYYEAAVDQAEEKRGFMDKTNVTEDASPKIDSQEQEQKEKKGIFEKIKEKIPGYNSKATQN